MTRVKANPLQTFLRPAFFGLGLILVSACNAGDSATKSLVTTPTHDAAARSEKTSMWMTVNNRRFAITLADNASASTFAARLPLALDMAELNGNEKHADLPSALPTASSRLGTIHAGDLMLYGSSTLVVFYSTFKSSYSYTRIGRIEDSAELAHALGRVSVRVEFSND